MKYGKHSKTYKHKKANKHGGIQMRNKASGRLEKIISGRLKYAELLARAGIPFNPMP